jgi:hypothetical protein
MKSTFTYGFFLEQCIHEVIISIPSMEDLTSSFEDNQPTPFHDHHLHKYIVAPIQ